MASCIDEPDSRVIHVGDEEVAQAVNGNELRNVELSVDGRPSIAQESLSACPSKGSDGHRC